MAADFSVRRTQPDRCPFACAMSARSKSMRPGTGGQARAAVGALARRGRQAICPVINESGMAPPLTPAVRLAARFCAFSERLCGCSPIKAVSEWRVQAITILPCRADRCQGSRTPLTWTFDTMRPVVPYSQACRQVRIRPAQRWMVDPSLTRSRPRPRPGLTWQVPGSPSRQMAGRWGAGSCGPRYPPWCIPRSFADGPRPHRPPQANAAYRDR